MVEIWEWAGKQNNRKNRNRFMNTRPILQRMFLIPVIALMAACSATDAPQPPSHEWAVTVSRAVTGGGQVTVALRYGTTTSYGTLQPAATEGENATWVGDKPTWPEPSTAVQAIAISPAVTELPVTVDAADGKAWLMDAVWCNADRKPAGFTLTHLMAQLEVHIRLHDEAMHHYEPTDASVGLMTTATIDYDNKCLTAASGYQADRSLGRFEKESDSADTDENWVNTPQVVIPQTLASGEPCLRFVVNGHRYTFVPEEDIVLTAGKKTKLYLGAAYDEMEGETVTLASVSIAGWDDGGSLGGGVADRKDVSGQE